MGWRGWRLALSTKEARVSAPVVPHCLLSASLLPAPRVIRNCPAGPGAGRARVLVAAGPVCRRAIRTPRWWSTRWAPGQIRRICASAGCCSGGRLVGTGVGCGESAAAGRRGQQPGQGNRQRSGRRNCVRNRRAKTAIRSSGLARLLQTCRRAPPIRKSNRRGPHSPTAEPTDRGGQQTQGERGAGSTIQLLCRQSE